MEDGCILLLFSIKVVYQDGSFVWDIHSEMSGIILYVLHYSRKKSCLRFSIEVIIVKGVPEVKGTMVLQRHTFETGITLLIEVL